MNRVLVTGASGFIGSAVVEALHAKAARPVSAASRRAGVRFGSDVRVHDGLELAAGTDWSAALQGVSCIVHAAARVHVMHEDGPQALTRFRSVNVEGTLRLATQAAALGVRRFVFLSSIKVHGETTEPGAAFHADSPLRPQDPYATSKAEAETALRAIASTGGMELVIVRPTLVYGPGVGANFRNMMRWLRRGLPLPFGALDNRRSLLARANLVDLVTLCIDHPSAAGEAFLASDGEDLSTPELLRRLGRSLGRPARLLPVPPAALRLAFGSGLAQRLCGSLQADIGKTRERLGWAPPVGVDAALAVTADDFLAGPR